MSGELPVFSIIIPTCKQLEILAHCLDALTLLDYPSNRFEIIVVDDGSPESPQVLIQRHSAKLNFHLVSQDNKGVSKARNAGAQVARGKYLVFTGDDCRPSSDWLQAFELCLADKGEVTAMGGSIRNDCPDNVFSEATHLLIDYLCKTPGSDSMQERLFTPNNLLVPALEFQAIGGFDPQFSFSTGEDRDFCSRWSEAGFQLEACPGAEVAHHHPLSMYSFINTHWRYGRGSFHYRRKRASRQGNKFFTESLGYYYRLVLYPVHLRGLKAWPLALLMFLSQCVNVASMLATWTRQWFRIT